MNPNDREVQVGTLAIRTSTDGSGCTVRLSGELDLSNAEALENELKTAAASGSGNMVVDIQELEFIDSTGIALLVDLLGEDHGTETAIEFIPSRSPAVARVLEMTGVAKRLPLSRQAP